MARLRKRGGWNSGEGASSRLLCLTVFASLCGAAAPETTTGVRTIMQTFDNGMRLIVEPRDFNDVLALSVFIQGGSVDDPRGREGLANLTQRLLIKGAAGKSAQEIAETIESVGGGIRVSAGEDYCEVSTVTAVEDLSTALSVLAAVVLRPDFDPEEIDKERALVLSAIRRREDDPFAFTRRELLGALYEGHPYGHPPEGDEPSVAALTREEIVDCHARRCRPDRLILSACGNVDPLGLRRAVEEAFETFPPLTPGPRWSLRKDFRPRFRQIKLYKDCKQAFIVVGFPAVPRSHPDYAALRVANAALGEGMSGRLFRRLRDERSLAYSVGSALSPRRIVGHLAMWIGTSPQSAETARLGLLSEARSAARDLSVEEIARAKRYIVGKHLIARQSNSAKAGALGACEALGLGYAYDTRFPDLVRGVTPSQAMEALGHCVGPSISVSLLPTEEKDQPGDGEEGS